ncbi:MAG: hypothetical protein AAB618_03830 [Patescibacteria group bacterium]
MCKIFDAAGNPAPNVNWGNTDLTGVDSSLYPNVDFDAMATRSGYTGPQYVRMADDRLGDVATGRIVPAKIPPQNVGHPMFRDRTQAQDAASIVSGKGY